MKNKISLTADGWTAAWLSTATQKIIRDGLFTDPRQARSYLIKEAILSVCREIVLHDGLHSLPWAVTIRPETKQETKARLSETEEEVRQLGAIMLGSLKSNIVPIQIIARQFPKSWN